MEEGEESPISGPTGSVELNHPWHPPPAADLVRLCECGGRLTRVSLAGCAIGGGDVKPLAHALAASPVLSELELADNALGDAGCSAVVHALSTAGRSRWCLSSLGHRHQRPAASGQRPCVCAAAVRYAKQKIRRLPRYTQNSTFVRLL
eukprot:SAG22_NODE_1884_length_3377_cov_29.524100_2_plen_148_part_00